MIDYIDREDTIKTIESETYRHDYLDHVIDIIEAMPSADVAPVRHGRLVDEGISASGHRLTMCTICKRKMREGIEIGIVSRYCPNCGVRLDEEAEK